MGGFAAGTTTASMRKQTKQRQEKYEAVKNEQMQRLGIPSDFEEEYGKAFEEYQQIFTSLDIKIFLRSEWGLLSRINPLLRRKLNEHDLLEYVHVYRSERHDDEISMHISDSFPQKAGLARILLSLSSDKFEMLTTSILRVKELEWTMDNLRTLVSAELGFRENLPSYLKQASNEYFQKIYTAELERTAWK